MNIVNKDKSELKNDIFVAQQIVETPICSNNIFGPYSFTYLTTNERMKYYQEYLTEVKKMLTVTSSSDQIFNSILGNSTNIDTFDISHFPKYLYELKKAGLKILSRDEFLKFFFENHPSLDEFKDDNYDLMKYELDSDARLFWDALFGYYECFDIFASTLFSRPSTGNDTIIDNNDYLKEENYNQMKTKVDKANLRFYDSDIKSLIPLLDCEYDLVNLSNIIDYVKEYNQILKSIPLTEDGTILTYLFEVNRKLKKQYPECTFKSFKEDSKGIMLYKK